MNRPPRDSRFPAASRPMAGKHPALLGGSLPVSSNGLYGESTICGAIRRARRNGIPTLGQEAGMTGSTRTGSGSAHMAGHVIVTLAGTGEADSRGDGGPADRAALHQPRALAVDASGACTSPTGRATGSGGSRRTVPSPPSRGPASPVSAETAARPPGRHSTNPGGWSATPRAICTSPTTGTTGYGGSHRTAASPPSREPASPAPVETAARPPGRRSTNPGGWPWTARGRSMSPSGKGTGSVPSAPTAPSPPSREPASPAPVRTAYRPSPANCTIPSTS